MPGGNPNHDAEGKFASSPSGMSATVGGSVHTPLALSASGSPHSANKARPNRNQTIHDAYHTGGSTVRELADQHGISTARVYQIVSGRRPGGGIVPPPVVLNQQTVSASSQEHLPESTPPASAVAQPLATQVVSEPSAQTPALPPRTSSSAMPLRGPGVGGARNPRDDGVHAMRAQGATHDQIAQHYGISPARVHQVLRDYRPEGTGPLTPTTSGTSRTAASTPPPAASPVAPTPTPTPSAPSPAISAAPSLADYTTSHLTLNPMSTLTKEAVRNYLGRDVSESDLAKMAGAAGAPKGAEVSFSGLNTGFSVKVSHPLDGEYSMDRSFRKDPAGKKYCYNAYFTAGSFKGGTGVSCFHSQVLALQKEGFDRIEVSAAGRGNGATGPSGDFTGYHTWARFGYAADLSSANRAALSRETDPDLKNARTTFDIMKTAATRDWWWKNGTGFSGEFNLDPQSRSSKALGAYVSEPGTAAKMASVRSNQQAETSTSTGNSGLTAAHASLTSEFGSPTSGGAYSANGETADIRTRLGRLGFAYQGMNPSGRSGGLYSSVIHSGVEVIRQGDPGGDSTRHRLTVRRRPT